MSKLRDFIEGTQEPAAEHLGHDDFEVLKESPMLGDNKFKLEIGDPSLTNA